MRNENDDPTRSRKKHEAETFDYVVVGSGAAGSIISSRLAEDGKFKVCVLEAGPPDWHPTIHIPAGFVRVIHDPRFTWQFKTAPNGNTGNRQIPLPQGQTVGGSTSINGMIYNRGQRADFDHWQQLGNRGWGYSDVLPYFMRSERRMGFGETLFRGRSGQMPVTDIDLIHPLAEAFITGATELGIPSNPDYNGAVSEGVSYCQRMIENGRRISAARAFIRPLRKQGNLKILTNARAVTVLFDGRRAIGIKYLDHRGSRSPRHVYATQEVILSCGSINTAKLLQMSGLGPAALLQSIGVNVRVDLPGVGRNFRDHFQIRLVARTKGIETFNELARGPKLLLQIGRWLAGRASILGLGPSPVYYCWRSDPAISAADIGGVFTPASFRQGQVGVLDTVPGMTCGLWQHRPESVGFVRATSSDPYDDPIVQPNYLAAQIDRAAVVGGMRLARRLLRSPSLSKYFQEEIFPGPSVMTDEALLDVARNYGGSAFHPTGTAKMGPPDDPEAVVDDQLRVRNVGALRVVDASIMPNIPSANTVAATMMIAEKAADLVLARPAPEPVMPGP